MDWFEKVGEIGEAFFAAGDKVGDVFNTLVHILDSFDRPREHLPPGARPLKGDIIARQSQVWWHVAVYENENSVYHYLPAPNELQKGKIVETSFAEFCASVSEYFIVVFGDTTVPWVLEAACASSPGPSRPRFREELIHDPDSGYVRYGAYPPKEIVERAKARLGEANYDLFGWNCEHFAMWCATGVARSLQVDRLEKFAKAIKGEQPTCAIAAPFQWNLKPTKKELAASVPFEVWKASKGGERPKLVAT